jgi:hypothetical protein
VMNPGCDNRRPDQAAFQAFVREAVRRYGRRVHFWGFWNEPNYAIFWHRARDPSDPSDPVRFDQNLQDLVSTILIPGYEAAKAENPGVEIAGPETDRPSAGLAHRIARQRGDNGRIHPGNRPADLDRSLLLLRFQDRQM